MFDRSKYLTASEFGCLFGVGYKTYVQLLESKRSPEPEKIKTDSLLGTYLEDGVREAWLATQENPPKVLAIRERAYLGRISGEVDALMQDKNGVFIYEGKTNLVFHQSDEWGEKDTDEVPMRYYVQAQVNMMLRGLTRVRLVCAMTGPSLKQYLIQYDPEFCEFLKQKAAEFFRHLDNGTYPDPQTIDDLKIIYKNSAGEVEADEKIVYTWIDYVDTRIEIKKLLDENEARRFELVKYMAQNSAIVTPEGVRICSKDKRGGVRIK